MKRFISIIIIVMTAVSLIIFHYNEYLLSVSQTPSMDWSRDFKYGSKKYNKSTYIFTYNGKILTVLPEDNRIKLINIKDPREIETKYINVDGLKEADINNIKFYNGRLYFLKKNSLWSVNIDGGNLINYEINLNGYTIINNEIIAFNDSGVYLYKFENDRLTQTGNLQQIKNIREIDVKEINNKIYVALLTGINYDRFIYLLTYDGSKWDNLNPLHKLSISSFTDIENLRIAYDGGIYLFYNLTSKSDYKLNYFYFKNGVLDNSGDKSVVLNINRIGNVQNISSYDVLDDNRNVYLAASGNVVLSNFGNQPNESTEIIYSKWKDGKPIMSELATRTGTWASMPTLLKIQNDEYLTWIEAGGFERYDVYAASTNKVYKEILNNIRLVDKQYAVSTSIQRNAASLLLGLIFIIAGSLPAYGWFVVILLFEPKKFRNEAILSFYIGSIIYSISKYIFYPPQSIKINIHGFAFPYNFILMPLVFTVISFILTKIYFGGKKFNSNFAAFTFMLIIDAILTNLFYAPFVIR